MLDDAFVAVGNAYVAMVKLLKDDDPTPEFVQAFLAANLPKGSDKLIPMLSQIFAPITAYVRVKQKMAKQGEGVRLALGVGFTYFDLVMDVAVGQATTRAGSTASSSQRWCFLSCR